MKKIVYIDDISYEGAGVAKADGKVVFVPKVLVGETVEISIAKDNSSYSIGKLENVVVESKARKNAECPYYDVCGGCDFQHCKYEKEIELKKYILSKELSKVGFCGEIEFVCADNRFGYRNKIKLEIRNNVLGYFKAKSHEFFKIEKCPIATEKINSVLSLIQDYLKVQQFKNLKNIYIKQVAGEIGICFLFDKNSQKMHEKFKKYEKLNNFSIFYAYGDILESNKTKVFCVQGAEKLIKKYKNFNLETEISAFNQINDEIAEKLYRCVLNEVNGKRIVNAYSGQGLLTALASETAKFVYGIEYQQSAHIAAQKLTHLKNNVENICGKVEDKLFQILLRDKIDLIILDPAREGCQKSVLEAINNQKIQKIVYISCNFSTLTRDLIIFKEKYDIENIKIFDMFPCTANMEVVAVLSRK